MRKLLIAFVVFCLCHNLSLAKTELTSEPPGAQKYIKKQIHRKPVLRPYVAKGYIGEAETGYLAIRTVKGLKKAEAEKLKKLVAEENEDRKHVYAEIIKYNKLGPEMQKEMIKSFYDVQKGSSAKGNYYYENRQWQKKY